MKINNIAVCISGGGSTFKYILDAIERGEIGATRISLVISSSQDAGGIQHAIKAGIPHVVLSRKMFESDEAFGEAILDVCDRHKVDLIAMAGFLQLMPKNVIEYYRGRILNQHPGDTKKFGGSEMYGIKVHRAVLAAGEKRTCVTIHYATEEYDKGPIIIQMYIEVPEGATAEELAAKLLPFEHIAYVTALRVVKKQLEAA